MTDPGPRRFRIRDVLMMVVLAALVVALAVQAQKVARLEARSRTVDSEMVKLMNTIAKIQMQANQNANALRRDVDALRKAAVDPKPAVGSPGGKPD